MIHDFTCSHVHYVKAMKMGNRSDLLLRYWFVRSEILTIEYGWGGGSVIKDRCNPRSPMFLTLLAGFTTSFAHRNKDCRMGSIFFLRIFWLEMNGITRGGFFTNWDIGSLVQMGLRWLKWWKVLLMFICWIQSWSERYEELWRKFKQATVLADYKDAKFNDNFP